MGRTSAFAEACTRVSLNFQEVSSFSEYFLCFGDGDTRWWKVMRRIKNGVSSKTRESEVSVVVHQQRVVVTFTIGVIDWNNNERLMLTSVLCVIVRSGRFALAGHGKEAVKGENAVPLQDPGQLQTVLRCSGEKRNSCCRCTWSGVHAKKHLLLSLQKPGTEG
ncbi:hypothetical protein V5799_007228 [Amblyomma americanum]|uniref:Uncharacterized protein n=1 Tax=Amblyomma americanum TaxID=6943 RepID=A0AAQ4DU51_AMBAM